MKKEEALKKIDDLANVITVEIPEEIEIENVKYQVKEDITQGNREKMLAKYSALYEEIRNKIREMNDVPDCLVEKALVLRRCVMFLKDYRASSEMDDKKRWMEYVKKVGL